MTKLIKPKADYLIEVSYEVANRRGGVYTVLTTKVEYTNKAYRGNYYLIGPYYKRFASIEFEEATPPNEMRTLFEELKKQKILCHYGFWLVEGKPKTILIDFSGKLKDIKGIKDKLTKQYNVDCKTGTKPLKQFNIASDNISTKDINLKIVWGYTASLVIQSLLQLPLFRDKKGVLQFHFADHSFIAMKDLQNKEVGIVATAHSTRMGRRLALNNIDINKLVKDGLKKGKKLPKGKEYEYDNYDISNHQLEILAAKYADVLTSVSEVTGKEMRYIIGRGPEIITPNGLDMSTLPSLEERSIIHIKAKERIYRFLNAYFLPYHSIDIPNSLLFFTSGRYELTTKGYDILFEALAKLNKRLKKEKYPNTIFVFLFIMIEGKEANDEILGNMTVYDAIEHTVASEFPHVEKRIISSLVHGHEIKGDMLFDEHFLIESKKLMLKFKRGESSNPPVCAFKGLKKDDIVMKFLKRCGLDNKEDDKVKVIFYPAPVSVADGLLSMEYHEVVSGMHLGIFPSMYEPWGYTPLETSAHGVMTITTDIAGFGKFIQKHSDQRKKPGILILKREGKKRGETITELENMLYLVAKLSRKERINKKLEAYNLAISANWKDFSKYYIQAHNLAIKKSAERQKHKKKS